MSSLRFFGLAGGDSLFAMATDPSLGVLSGQRQRRADKKGLSKSGRFRITPVQRPLLVDRSNCRLPSATRDGANCAPRTNRSLIAREILYSVEYQLETQKYLVFSHHVKCRRVERSTHRQFETLG